MKTARSMARHEKEVMVPVDTVQLKGIVGAPPESNGVVVFAHGSGSGRFSPRNNFVARAQEETLGTIHDFVIDNGRISFAILSHGGFFGIGQKLVGIPFGSLSYDSTQRYFVLDISRERLESAPAFASTDLTNRKWAEDVYKFFGLQPYWPEGGGDFSRRFFIL